MTQQLDLDGEAQLVEELRCCGCRRCGGRGVTIESWVLSRTDEVRCGVCGGSGDEQRPAPPEEL